MFSMKTLAFQYRNFKQRSTGNDFITQSRARSGPSDATASSSSTEPIDARPAKTAAGRNPTTLSWPPQELAQAIRRNRSVIGLTARLQYLASRPPPFVCRNHPTRPAAERGLDSNLSQDPVGLQRNLSCNETSGGRP